MIADINPRGHSFKGVTAYLLHDKGAETSERVAWTATYNLHTSDIEKASRFMAWTDVHREDLRAQSGGSTAGRKATRGNVYHFSLSWEPGAEIAREEMENVARSAVEALRLEEHQFYLVGHSDTGHPHVHVVVNLVHPERGRVASNWKDREVLDRWANAYELEHGVVCQNRAEKYEKLAGKGRGKVFPETPAERRRIVAQIVTEAFHMSDSGAALQAALEEEGLTLAQGTRRGVVVVDGGGKVYALNKLVELADGSTGRAKTRQINARIGDLDREALPLADALQAERQAGAPERAAEVGDPESPALPEGGSAPRKARRKPSRNEPEALQLKERGGDEQARATKRRQLQWRAMQLRIARAVREARDRWWVDAIAKQLAEAKDARAALTGFWARVFRRREIAEAQQAVEALERHAGERSQAFFLEAKTIHASERRRSRPRTMPRSSLARGLEASVGGPARLREECAEPPRVEKTAARLRKERDRDQDLGLDHS